MIDGADRDGEAGHAHGVDEQRRHEQQQRPRAEPWPRLRRHRHAVVTGGRRPPILIGCHRLALLRDLHGSLAALAAMIVLSQSVTE